METSRTHTLAGHAIRCPPMHHFYRPTGLRVIIIYLSYSTAISHTRTHSLPFETHTHIYTRPYSNINRGSQKSFFYISDTEMPQRSIQFGVFRLAETRSRPSLRRRRRRLVSRRSPGTSVRTRAQSLRTATGRPALGACGLVYHRSHCCQQSVHTRWQTTRNSAWVDAGGVAPLLLLPCCIAAGCSPFSTWTSTLAGSDEEGEQV